nr:RraA family protein [Fredinandcohnia onubensis]
MENLGFRILPKKNKLSRDTVERFRDVVTPHISDNFNRVHAIGSTLRPFHRSGKLLGTAITVKTRPGDNLLVHKAIDIATPGDVIVVDAGGDTTNAIVGEIMLQLARKNGVTGFVIDGAIRDSKAFVDENFPVFAKAITHRGPYKDGPGEINVPISIAGMLVNPGDIIVGDEDGLAVIPADYADEILEKVKSQEKNERAILESIANGTVDRSWVDETLKQKGCELDASSNKV